MNQITRRIILKAVLIVGMTSLNADSSGELIKTLNSPLFMGGGTSVIRMDTPQAVTLNPAAAGNFQRIILDASYVNLQEWDSGMQGMGHVFNTGLSYPGKYGVLTGALHVVTLSDFDHSSLDFGTFGSMDLTFSKELYKNLYTGFGVSGAYGTEDWGAGLNIGFIHKPGTIGKFRKLKWGASLTGLGYNYGSASDYMAAIPENLTFNVGAGFDLIEKEDFLWSMSGDVGFPTLSDLRFEVAQEVNIQDKLRIALSSSMILTDLLDGDYQTVIPSFGIYYNYQFKGKEDGKTEKQTSEIEIQCAYAPLYDNIHGIGSGVTIPFGVRDTTPPSITLEQDHTVYISPDLNGVQDEIETPFTVNDERYVMGYYLTIRNEDGDIVKEFRNKDERPENESFKNIFDRMFTEKKGTSIPESFRWDGVMDSGELAPDGKYTYSLQFWDDNDNMSETGSYPIEVDTVQPTVILEKQEGIDLIFSPDGDGNKDILLITQEGSSENLWEADIQNLSGDTVRNITWEEGSPEAFEWDGKDNSGVIVPDGVYSYIVRSTDPAGNFVEDSLVDILINTEKPPVSLTIDNSFISPGNREGNDTIQFGTGIPVTAGILEWEVQVLDSRSNVAWRYNSRREGVLEVPDSIAYKGEDSAGGFIDEGKYQGFMTVRYQNGYEPEVYSPWFSVDTTAPKGSISGSNILTLNETDKKFSLTLTLNTTEEDYWEGFIRNSENETVKSFFWRGMADPEIVWSGNDNQGKPVSDGSYFMVLEATDKAGNRAVSAAHRIQLDTREMSVQVSVSENAFSPDSDGIKDKQILYPLIDEPENITNWNLHIYSVNVSGIAVSPVKSWSGTGKPGSEFFWDGQSDDENIAPDGSYIAELTAGYTNGTTSTARSTEFLKDTQAPEITSRVSTTLFSPDGDGNKDTIRIVQTSSTEPTFEAILKDSSGNAVKSWFWKNRVESVEWDGRDENGNAVPDGVYQYSISSTDLAGHRSEVKIPGIEVDTKSTAVYLTAKNTLFSPVSEELPNQVFTCHVTNSDGIDRWVLTVYNQAGEAVKSISGNGVVPPGISWDGRDDKGRLIEGFHKGSLEVIYAKGNRPVAESREFAVDNTSPLVQLDLTPRPFSPDDDNVADELKIAIAVKDLSPIRDWKMIILDPKGNEFISFGGKGRPSERIIWDGRSRQGELVQSAEDYPYELRVTDLLGNSTLSKGKIPVDILVIRDGDNLKVMISNITFEPYKASLVSAGESGIKNRDILKRLSEVLNKYGTYKIVVEGHAVSEYYDNPDRAAQEEKEELQPLSLKRAATVRAALSHQGIQDSRMDVIGRGGTMPIVPHSDLENRWKNRRVEFILIK
ncbi:MAG: hypothetical protein B6241_05520 [Spirochaetaceae bacterium 4572_59]|nr:MAG: hypothetical protein B6241_05520 [Spirochaetaceae bacterium 4572_59]